MLYNYDNIQFFISRYSLYPAFLFLNHYQQNPPFLSCKTTTDFVDLNSISSWNKVLRNWKFHLTVQLVVDRLVLLLILLFGWRSCLRFANWWRVNFPLRATRHILSCFEYTRNLLAEPRLFHDFSACCTSALKPQPCTDVFARISCCFVAGSIHSIFNFILPQNASGRIELQFGHCCTFPLGARLFGFFRFIVIFSPFYSKWRQLRFPVV